MADTKIIQTKDVRGPWKRLEWASMDDGKVLEAGNGGAYLRVVWVYRRQWKVSIKVDGRWCEMSHTFATATAAKRYASGGSISVISAEKSKESTI